MRKDGFTIIELLVATALVGVILVFTLEMFTVNNRSYTRIDSVVGTQQAMRVIASVLERDIRHTGMMVPEAASLCVIDSDTASDRVYVTDHTAVDHMASTQPFAGADITSAGTQVSAGTATFSLDNVILEGAASGAAYDTDGNGTNDSDFRVGGGVIIFDASNPARGTSCGPVTVVNAGTDTVTVNIISGALGTAAAGADLFMVPALELRITGGALFRNGLRLAEGVEDLQVAVFLDDNGNSVVDAGERRGDGVGADYVASALDHTTLRDVRFNVVLRSRLDDPQFTTGFFQTSENRNAVAGSDGFRRRVYSNTVRIRNLGDRGVGV